MRTNSQIIRLIISVLFLAFACGVFLFLYSLVSKNKKEAERISTEWQAESTRREEIRSVDSYMKIIEGDVAELETHFAESTNVVPFLDTLELLARRAKAESEVTSVDISKDNKVLTVGVRASGSFEVVYTFLVLLENSPYELEFTSVDFNKQSGSEDPETGVVSS